MRRRGFPIVLCALLLSCAMHHGRPAGEQRVLDLIDSRLAALAPLLRYYPPQFTSEDMRQEVIREWNETETELKVLAVTHPEDAEIQWRLGELYRFGYNLDLPGTGPECIAHLQRAIALKPGYVDAYLTLGIFYTDVGPEWARLGETNLRKAIDLSAPKPLPRGWRALTLAYYYQGRYADSVTAADTYLSLVPDDEDVRKFRSVAQEAAERGDTKPGPVGQFVLP